jgi:hypothetical protein
MWRYEWKEPDPAPAVEPVIVTSFVTRTVAVPALAPAAPAPRPPVAAA